MKIKAMCIAAFVLAAPGLAGAAAEDAVETMAREHADDRPVPAAAAGEPTLDVDGGPVRYGAWQGYAARPKDEPKGGVIVIHEWWGLNDNIREMARRLAAEGYLALAVDVYDGRSATEPGEARELVSAAMSAPERTDENLRAAYAWLEARGVPAIGSIGWCFGGGLSLQAALLHPDSLDAAVIYYGHVTTDRDELASLEMPILGIFGAEDQAIPLDDVREFEATLKDLGKSADVVVYPGAGHAFANPSGTNYEAEAAADAWTRTLEFFDRYLARAP